MDPSPGAPLGSKEPPLLEMILLVVAVIHHIQLKGSIRLVYYKPLFPK